MKSTSNQTRILVPEPDPKDKTKRFKVSLPKRVVHKAENFPPNFETDRPSAITDMYAREIIKMTEKNDKPFKVFIDLEEFVDINFPWLAFTIALHTLILAPKGLVYFRGINPKKFSRQLDIQNPRGVMDCIRNFCVYLNTTKGDRAGRVFEQVSTDEYTSFEVCIMPEMTRTNLTYSSYYNRWLYDPYVTESGYVNHPFDHLPVKNMSRRLRDDYKTKAQWQNLGYDVPDIDKAVFLHDQIGTVSLRPYWHKSVVTKAPKKKKSAKATKTQAPAKAKAKKTEMSPFIISFPFRMNGPKS